MAIAGQKPKPATLRLLEGKRGHRPIKEGYKVAPVMPKMPQWLTPLAKTEWKRIGPELFKNGVLAREDRAAFECYCENYAKYCQCRNFIKSKGGYAIYIIWWANRASGPPRHIDVMEKSMTQIRLFCAEFGCTPSSRMRIEIKNIDSEEPGYLD